MVQVKEPLVRRDKKCASAGCSNDLPELCLEQQDPFCSTACANRHYGVTPTGAAALPRGPSDEGD
jgi:hypothetical protein